MTNRERVTYRVGFFAFIFATTLLYGCSPESTPSVEEQQTLAHVMDPLLNEASEVFWDSAGFIDTYEGTTDLTPTTDEGWQKVLDAADEITRLSASSSGRTILIESTGLERTVGNAGRCSRTWQTRRDQSRWRRTISGRCGSLSSLCCVPPIFLVE